MATEMVFLKHSPDHIPPFLKNLLCSLHLRKNAKFLTCCLVPCHNLTPTFLPSLLSYYPHFVNSLLQPNQSASCSPNAGSLPCSGLLQRSRMLFFPSQLLPSSSPSSIPFSSASFKAQLRPHVLQETFSASPSPL